MSGKAVAGICGIFIIGIIGYVVIVKTNGSEARRTAEADMDIAEKNANLIRNHGMAFNPVKLPSERSDEGMKRAIEFSKNFTEAVSKLNSFGPALFNNVKG